MKYEYIYQHSEDIEQPGLEWRLHTCSEGLVIWEKVTEEINIVTVEDPCKGFLNFYHCIECDPERAPDEWETINE